MGAELATGPADEPIEGVATLLHLTRLDPGYPARLRFLPKSPATLTVQGGPLDAAHAIAIVGSRSASEEARTFARELAKTLVRSGAVVVSGGAFGVDAAAHVGALEAGGRTWVIAGTSCDRAFPPEHAALFDRIGQGPGAMVWPFSPPGPARGGFLRRNRVLVALSDAVVVVQAGARSGALAAADCARQLGTPLWVVPPPPGTHGYDGSKQLLEKGVRALIDAPAFLAALRLREDGQDQDPPLVEPPPADPPLEGDEKVVLAATLDVPEHVDHIAERAHLATQTATAALLTLALEAVVVEGPPGFFRRQRRPNK